MPTVRAHTHLIVRAELVYGRTNLSLDKERLELREPGKAKPAAATRTEEANSRERRRARRPTIRRLRGYGETKQAGADKTKRAGVHRRTPGSRSRRKQILCG
jgi:hypothetical protein